MSLEELCLHAECSQLQSRKGVYVSVIQCNDLVTVFNDCVRTRYMLIYITAIASRGMTQERLTDSTNVKVYRVYGVGCSYSLKNVI